MSKELVIKSNNCVLSKSQYGVKINDTDIEKLIIDNLPQEMKEYRDYPARVNISISILGDDPVKIQRTGYKVPKKEEIDNAI